MRWRRNFVWIALLGAAVIWPGPRFRPQAAAALEDNPVINRPNLWDSAGTVLAVGALSTAILALGLTWYAVDQSAQRTAIAKALTHGDADRAPAVITRYGCGGCHTIPGAPGADGAHRSSSMTDSTINADEVEKFGGLAEEWWDPKGKFRPIHKFNPVRLAYIRDQAIDHFGRDGATRRPFEGLRVLDIGCGGGLLSEPLSRMGAEVTGVDAAEMSIAAAPSLTTG